MNGRSVILAVIALIIGVLIGPRIASMLSNDVNKQLGYCIDPTKVAQLTLTALKKQNKLTVLEADISARTEARVPGIVPLLDATKTLSASGKMLYQIDFSQVSTKDMRWDQATKTLTLDVPPPTATGPVIDLTRISETKDGRIVMLLSNAEARLDVETRKSLQGAIRKVAENDAGLKAKARDAAREAIVRDFSLPLEAVGVTGATVAVRFNDDRT